MIEVRKDDSREKRLSVSRYTTVALRSDSFPWHSTNSRSRSVPLKIQHVIANDRGAPVCLSLLALVPGSYSSTVHCIVV